MNTKSKSFKEGIKFILIGVFLILISLFIHTIHIIDTENKILLHLNEIVIQIFSHLGIGALAIGILSIMLDMDHWTTYFENRLSNIVMKKSYLHNLNDDDLANLQREVLKVYFKNDDIELKEGFLHYYQKNIQKFIGQPYRKNVVMQLILNEIIVQDEDGNNIELFEVSESMTYVCKKNGNHIQKNICYIPDEYEHYSTDDFYVKLQHPIFDGNAEANNLNEIIFDIEKLISIGACPDTMTGFDLDIQDYATDDLNVMLKAKYKIKKDRFFGWRMSHPTLDLTIIVNYPAGYVLASEYYFSEDNSYSLDNDENSGRFFLKINEWLLPDEGLTLQLTKK